MSLWDPEAAGNAAIFLRLDDMKMLEIRNAPFEGGKAVWVPNSETGYIKGMITGEGEKPGTTKVSFYFWFKYACRSFKGYHIIVNNKIFRSCVLITKKKLIPMIKLKNKILQSTNCSKIWLT